MTSAQLQTTDAEQTAAQLTYTVIAPTRNGALMLSGTALVANGAFTQAEIDSGSLTYEHGGSETTSDNFTFAVSDGNLSVSDQTFTEISHIKPD